MKKDYKTTALGVATIITAVSSALIALLDGNPARQALLQIVLRGMVNVETAERLDAEDSHVRSGHVVLSVNCVGLSMTPPTLFPWCLRGSGINIRLDATLDTHNPLEM